MRNKPFFKIGDTVETKSNGYCQITGINIFTTRNNTSIRYTLSGFKEMLFYEEDLKYIQGDNDMKVIRLMKLDERATIPKFAKEGDSGFDMYTLEDTIIKAGETKLVKTGIAANLEGGWEIQVRPRSGVSLNGMKGCYTDGEKVSISSALKLRQYGKKDLKECQPYLRVQFGTVDSNYRGDISIITHNQESYDILIPRGTRLAQCVVQQVPKVEIVEVFKLSNSERGTLGFGSTGVE